MFRLSTHSMFYNVLLPPPPFRSSGPGSSRIGDLLATVRAFISATEKVQRFLPSSQLPSNCAYTREYIGAFCTPHVPQTLKSYEGTIITHDLDSKDS